MKNEIQYVDLIIEFLNNYEVFYIEAICKRLNIDIDYECSSLYDKVKEKHIEVSFEDVAKVALNEIILAIKTFNSEKDIFEREQELSKEHVQPEWCGSTVDGICDGHTDQSVCNNSGNVCMLYLCQKEHVENKDGEIQAHINDMRSLIFAEDLNGNIDASLKESIETRLKAMEQELSQEPVENKDGEMKQCPFFETVKCSVKSVCGECDYKAIYDKRFIENIQNLCILAKIDVTKAIKE